MGSPQDYATRDRPSPPTPSPCKGEGDLWGYGFGNAQSFFTRENPTERAGSTNHTLATVEGMDLALRVLILLIQLQYLMLSGIVLRMEHGGTGKRTICLDSHPASQRHKQECTDQDACLRGGALKVLCSV